MLVPHFVYFLRTKQLLANDRFQFTALIICLEARQSPYNPVLLRLLMINNTSALVIT